VPYKLAKPTGIVKLNLILITGNLFFYPTQVSHGKFQTASHISSSFSCASYFVNLNMRCKKIELFPHSQIKYVKFFHLFIPGQSYLQQKKEVFEMEHFLLLKWQIFFPKYNSYFDRI